MPNWVENRLSFTGEPEQVKRVKEQLGASYTRLVERWNPETNAPESKDEEYTGVLSFWNIIKPTNLDAYHAPCTAEAMYDPDNWYMWNNRNWGTKWDASSPQIDEETAEGITYSFSTAWAPPMNAIGTLSEQHPDITFFLRYEEEQGWGGVEKFINGEMETEEEWDIPSSHAENEAIGRPCVCEWDDEPEDWYDDCPDKESTLQWLAEKETKETSIG